MNRRDFSISLLASGFGTWISQLVRWFSREEEWNPLACKKLLNLSQQCHQFQANIKRSFRIPTYFAGDIGGSRIAIPRIAVGFVFTTPKFSKEEFEEFRNGFRSPRGFSIVRVAFDDDERFRSYSWSAEFVMESNEIPIQRDQPE